MASAVVVKAEEKAAACVADVTGVTKLAESFLLSPKQLRERVAEDAAQWRDASKLLARLQEAAGGSVAVQTPRDYEAFFLEQLPKLIALGWDVGLLCRVRVQYLRDVKEYGGAAALQALRIGFPPDDATQRLSLFAQSQLIANASAGGARRKADRWADHRGKVHSDGSEVGGAKAVPVPARKA